MPALDRAAASDAMATPSVWMTPRHSPPAFQHEASARASPRSAPVSLYGSTKLACETVALEYGEAFGFPVWIDRCGVLAGAGQFGTPDQGIFSYWINAHLRRRPLRYIGFEARASRCATRFIRAIWPPCSTLRCGAARAGGQRIYTAGGGAENAMSLAQLTAWCDARFGAHAPQPDPRPRPYDVPWVVMDNSRRRARFRLARPEPRSNRFSKRSPATPSASGLAGEERPMSDPAIAARPTSRSRLLSVVIPARNEEGCIAATVEHLYVELRLHGIEHEIVVVDDGSTDSTWNVLQDKNSASPLLRRSRIPASTVSGEPITFGFDQLRRADAVVVMMADESDDCRDVVRYWQVLNEGWDAVFGSRFVRGGGVIDYPLHKLLLNRMANLFLRLMFHAPLNDFTNAFKAYRRKVIEGCRPFFVAAL